MKPTRKLSLLCLFLTGLCAFTNAQPAINTTQSLDGKQQSLVSISALAAVGNLDSLKAGLNTGLDSGLTINEIKEVLVHLYAYCGFPRSLNGLNTFMAVLNERKAAGRSDKQGKEPTIATSADKYEQGRKVLEQLSNTPQPKPAPGYGAFAPRIDAFLKEHLFADVFASDALTYQQRELVAISVLSSLPGLQAQLQSHLKLGLNTGLTESQLTEVADLIEKHISRTQANVLRGLLSKPPVPVVAPDVLVRISEIEIYPEHLEVYKATLKEEAAASVKIEPGVVSIFSMQQQSSPTQIRIVEIYRDSAAYSSHLKTTHFQHYKTSTAKMVKSLKLIDMNVLDKETMLQIFSKFK